MSLLSVGGRYIRTQVGRFKLVINGCRVIRDWFKKVLVQGQGRCILRKGLLSIHQQQVLSVTFAAISLAEPLQMLYQHLKK